MFKFTVCLLLAASAFGQKKPITLESMNAGGRGGGRGGAGAATWAPDGKTFVFRQGRSLMIYDPSTQSSKDLVALDAMDAAAVNPPPADGPFDWTNRRVRGGGLQFSSDGKELLYVSGGDLFLVHRDTGKWDQLTRTPVAEVDPKLSPDGKMVVFRRGWDLYSIDVATRKETPLTTHGAETLRNGGLDWVYPEELDLGTAFWWSPDSKSIAYLQFDTSREPIFPHEDLLRTRALYEPERYPQAGENNADVHLGVVAGRGRPHQVARSGRHPQFLSHRARRLDAGFQKRLRRFAPIACRIAWRCSPSAPSPARLPPSSASPIPTGSISAATWNSSRTASGFCGPASATASAISTCTPSTGRTCSS